jgi:hypothetical protein
MKQACPIHLLESRRSRGRIKMMVPEKQYMGDVIGDVNTSR